MAQLLLYNINDREKLVKIKMVLYRMGIACREVQAAELAHPIGHLLGRGDFAPAIPGGVEPFSDEMMVMDGLRGAQLDQFLDQLRSMDAAVSLKAVVTEHNIAWSSLQLHRELEREHQAMSRMKKSVHKKK